MKWIFLNEEEITHQLLKKLCHTNVVSAFMYVWVRYKVDSWLSLTGKLVCSEKECLYAPLCVYVCVCACAFMPMAQRDEWMDSALARLIACLMQRFVGLSRLFRESLCDWSINLKKVVYFQTIATGYFQMNPFNFKWEGFGSPPPPQKTIFFYWL